MWWWAALFSIFTTVAARRGVSFSSFSLRPPLLERLDYITTYACEGRELRVGCDNGGVIHLVRANYGRFSISICNDHGTLHWSVNCMSYRSFLIMQDKCSKKPSCSVVVSSSMFGDPCPGTLKYLEVQYHCVSGSGTTPGKLNSMLSTVSNMSNETTIERAEGGSPITSTTLYSSSSPLSSSMILDAVTTPYTELPIAKINTSMTTIYIIPKVVSSEQPVGNDDLIPEFREGFCTPLISRDLFWNWTKGGDHVIQKCPGGSTGMAKWQCGIDPVRWWPDVPDLQECKSFWVENLRRRMEDGESVINVSTELAQMTVNKAVFSEDLKDVTDLIQQTLTRTVNSMENFLDMWHRYHVLRELLQSLLETVSNLLEDDQIDAWEELTSLDRRQVTSSLLGELEESALLLADASGQDDSFTIAKTNVLLSVQVLNTRTLKSVQFPVLDEFRDDSASTAWIRMEDSLLLPAQALVDISRHGLAKVVFMAYSRVGEFLKPEFDYHPRSLSQEVSTEDESVQRNLTRIVNSRVIAASVGKHGMIRLTQPVVITLKHLQEDNVTNPYCVYWDFHEREWSGQGCWVQNFNKTHTICACDHLTNFAVIMDVRPIMEHQVYKDMLRVIITVGCAVCILCLLITVFLLFLLRNLKGDCIIIHRNLFLCLLITEAIFLGGIDQTTYHVVCGTIAGLLHYFLLATFAWASLEGFQHYVMLVDMIEEQKSRGWYYLLAYGVPAIIVAISAIVDPYSYGTEQYCWLRADNYFIYSFIGPAVGILFGGTVFLCLAVCIMCHHSSITTTVKGKEEAKLANIKSWIRLAVILLCILSLTWTSCLLYANGETIFLAYIFTVFNSLQGIFILVFYSFGNEKVREELRKFLHKRGLFPSQTYSPKPEDTTTSHQPNGTVPAVSSPSQHSIPPESWNSPKEENSSIVPKFITPGHPYTTVPNNQEVEKDKVSPNNSNNLQEPMKFTYCGLSTGTGVYGKRHKGSPYRQYSSYSDTYNSFPDHIYESIDPETSEHYQYYAKTQPHQNFDYLYGERSDISQRSSSSYGYEQHPLIKAPFSIRHYRLPLSQEVYGKTKTYATTSPKAQKCHRHDKYHRNHRRSSSDKLPNDVIQALDNVYNPNNGEIQHDNIISQKLVENNTTLPDLIKWPNNSSEIMAVLDGEKVVSYLQPDKAEVKQLNYKQSTYC